MQTGQAVCAQEVPASLTQAYPEALPLGPGMQAMGLEDCGQTTDEAWAPERASLPPANGAGSLAQLCLPPQHHLATVTS